MLVQESSIVYNFHMDEGEKSVNLTQLYCIPLEIKGQDTMHGIRKREGT